MNYSNILLFADDAKMFKLINCQNDSLLLQKDLDNINLWCKSNGMSLNLNKCHSISFSMKHNPIFVINKLDNHSLNRTSNINDLKIDSKLLFNLHIFKIKKNL